MLVIPQLVEPDLQLRQPNALDLNAENIIIIVGGVERKTKCGKVFRFT